MSYTDDDIRDGNMEIMAPQVQEVSPVVSAEISQQVATARRFPRRRDREIADEIMGRAALNEQIASECMYSLKRGRGSDAKVIPGPSIRFAEIVRASYGNIRVAARFVRLDLDDPERGAVIVEAVALDVQTNQSEIIQVRRSVMTSGSQGRRPQIYNADMINMTVNAAQSIARRNAILAVVPKAIWIEGYQRVVKVLKGDVATLEARRKEIIDAFVRIKVDPKDVYAALGVKDIDDITIEHIPELRGFMTAIAEGETPASVLGKAAEAAGGNGDHAKVANPLRDDPTPPKTSKPSPETAPADYPSAGEASSSVASRDDGAVAAGQTRSDQQPPENSNPAQDSSETSAASSSSHPTSGAGGETPPAESRRTESGGVSSFFAAFADALGRATQAKSLQALVKAHWERNEYPFDDELAKQRLDKIHKVHVKRIKQEITPKQAAEELKELVAG